MIVSYIILILFPLAYVLVTFYQNARQISSCKGCIWVNNSRREHTFCLLILYKYRVIEKDGRDLKPL